MMSGKATIVPGAVLATLCAVGVTGFGSARLATGQAMLAGSSPVVVDVTGKPDTLAGLRSMSLLIPHGQQSAWDRHIGRIGSGVCRASAAGAASRGR